MAVLPDDIKFLHTLSQDRGGAADTTNEVNQNVPKNNIFGQVTARESQAGMTDYRCIFVANNSATDDLKDAIVYLDVSPVNSSVRIELGIGRAAMNADEPEIADYNSVPQGVFFQRADSVDTGINLGDIPALSVRSIWLKRVIDAGSPASGNNQFVLAVLGETE